MLRKRPRAADSPPAPHVPTANTRPRTRRAMPHPTHTPTTAQPRVVALRFRRAVIHLLQSNDEGCNVDCNTATKNHSTACNNTCNNEPLTPVHSAADVAAALAAARTEMPAIVAVLRTTPLPRARHCNTTHVEHPIASPFLLAVERLFRLIALRRCLVAVAYTRILNPFLMQHGHHNTSSSSSSIPDFSSVTVDHGDTNDPINSDISTAFAAFDRFAADVDAFVTFTAVESKDIPTPYNVPDFTVERYGQIMTLRDLILYTYDPERNSVRSELLLAFKPLVSTSSTTTTSSTINPFPATAFQAAMFAIAELRLANYAERVILFRCRTLVDIRIDLLSFHNSGSALLPPELRNNTYGTKNVFASWVFKFTISVLRRWAFRLGEHMQCIPDPAGLRTDVVEATCGRETLEALTLPPNILERSERTSTQQSPDHRHQFLGLQRSWVRELVSYARDKFISSKLREIFDIVYQFSMGKHVIPVLNDIRECMEIGEDFYQKVDNALFAKLAFKDYEDKQLANESFEDRRDSIASIQLQSIMKRAAKQNDRSIVINGVTIAISKNKWSEAASSYASNKAQILIKFRQQLVTIMSADVKARFLHAGIPTFQIINFMIAMEEALKYLDPSSNLFLQIYSVLQSYLKRSRPNSIELILERLVSHLKKGLSSELVETAAGASNLVEATPQQRVGKGKSVDTLESRGGGGQQHTAIDNSRLTADTSAVSGLTRTPILGNTSSFRRREVSDIPNVSVDETNKTITSVPRMRFGGVDAERRYAMRSSESNESFLEEVAFESVLNDADSDDEEYRDDDHVDNRNHGDTDGNLSRQHTLDVVAATPKHFVSGLRRGQSTVSLMDADNDDLLDEQSLVFDTSTPLAAVSRYGSLNNLSEKAGKKKDTHVFNVLGDTADATGVASTTIGGSVTALGTGPGLVGSVSRRGSVGRRLADMTLDELVAFQRDGHVHFDNEMVDKSELHQRRRTTSLDSGSVLGSLEMLREDGSVRSAELPTMIPNITFEQVGIMNVDEHVAAIDAGLAALPEHDTDTDFAAGIDESRIVPRALKEEIDIYFSTWRPDPIDAVISTESGQFDLADRLISMVDSKRAFVKTQERRLLVQLLKCLDNCRATEFADDTTQSIPTSALGSSTPIAREPGSAIGNAFSENVYFGLNRDWRSQGGGDIRQESPSRTARFLWGTPGANRIGGQLANSATKLTKREQEIVLLRSAPRPIFDTAVSKLELDLLKKRMNDLDFNGCDVMLLDISSSRRTNVFWRHEMVSMISRLSQIYSIMQTAEEAFSDQYQRLQSPAYNTSFESTSTYLFGNTSLVSMDTPTRKIKPNGRQIGLTPIATGKNIVPRGRLNPPVSSATAVNITQLPEVFNNSVVRGAPVFVSYIISDVFWPLQETEYGLQTSSGPIKSTVRKPMGLLSRMNANVAREPLNVKVKSVVFDNDREYERLAFNSIDDNDAENDRRALDSQAAATTKGRLRAIKFEFRLPSQILRERELYDLYYKSSSIGRKQRLDYIYNLGSVDLTLDFVKRDSCDADETESVDFFSVTEIQATVIYFASLFSKFGSILQHDGVDYVTMFSDMSRNSLSDQGNDGSVMNDVSTSRCVWPQGILEHDLSLATQAATDEGRARVDGLHSAGAITLVETLAYHNHERKRIMSLLNEWLILKRGESNSFATRIEDVDDGFVVRCAFSVSAVVKILSEIPSRQSKASQTRVSNSENDTNSAESSLESLEASGIIVKELQSQFVSVLIEMVKEAFSFWETRGVLIRKHDSRSNINVPIENDTLFFMSRFTPST